MSAARDEKSRGRRLRRRGMLRLWLDLDGRDRRNRSEQPQTEFRNRLDDRGVLRVIAKCLAQLDDALRQRVRSDGHSWPHCIQNLIPGDDLAAGIGQVDQYGHRPRRDVHRLGAALDRCQSWAGRASHRDGNPAWTRSLLTWRDLSLAFFSYFSRVSLRTVRAAVSY